MQLFAGSKQVLLPHDKEEEETLYEMSISLLFIYKNELISCWFGQEVEAVNLMAKYLRNVIDQTITATVCLLLTSCPRF